MMCPYCVWRRQAAPTTTSLANTLMAGWRWRRISEALAAGGATGGRGSRGREQRRSRRSRRAWCVVRELLLCVGYGVGFVRPSCCCCCRRRCCDCRCSFLMCQLMMIRRPLKCWLL